MTKEEAIQKAKFFRVALDNVLQQMKEHRTSIIQDGQDSADDFPDLYEQHSLSVHDLESAIMRQGMVLKVIGTPNPYPDSYKPENSIVNPTADGLRL